jgi:hypothetical protein
MIRVREDRMAGSRTKAASAHFKTMVQSDVPQGRNGKHKEIVAIKVPLAELDASKEKVRSALNRATRKAGRKVATATDATFLYVWNESA